MTQTAEVRLIGTAAACALLKVDRSTVARWVQSGRLSPVQKLDGPTGAYLFDRAAVETLVAERAS